MKWPEKYTYFAGGILILLTNIIALGGVAYNRKGEPVTVMKLSERELRLPYYSKEDLKENSGIALDLTWQRAERHSSYGSASKRIQSNSERCDPGLLDQEKLKSLGFDVSKPADSPEGKMHYNKQLPREVLLVLELDGPAWHQSVEAARGRLADAEAMLKIHSSGKWGSVTGEKENVKYLKKQLEQAEKEDSRLFLIDAGLDIKALRSAYPDITRYAIVRGEVEIGHITCGEKNEFSAIRGWAKGLSITNINVPFKYRQRFETFRRLDASSDPADEERKAHPYEISVAYGQHLEPWMTDASWKNNVPSGK